MRLEAKKAMRRTDDHFESAQSHRYLSFTMRFVTVSLKMAGFAIINLTRYIILQIIMWLKRTTCFDDVEEREI